MALKKIQTSQDLTAAPMSFTIPAQAGDYKLVAVHARASVAISESIKITRVDPDTNYSDQIGRKVLAAQQDAVFAPDNSGGLDLPKVDLVKVECTNANLTGTLYVTIILFV